MKNQPANLIAALLCVFVLDAPAVTRCVDLNSPSPTPPFLDWVTAATNIQDAIDAAVDGDVVLVTNGFYSTGEQAARIPYDNTNYYFYSTNRVVVSRPLTLQSVNGPDVTVIDGSGSVRCVYLANGAVLAGFTLTNGVGYGDGGGVLCASTNALVANCLVISNRASYGGGVANGSVSNCTLTYNYSSGSGGGARSCALYQCTLSQNTAGSYGGGASGGISSLNRCLVFGNFSADSGGGVFGSLVNNCVVVSNKTQHRFDGGGAASCVIRN